ncbi:restriction endonuclease [Escherichia coli]|nr:restriction endonuclease [Escherichia coli]
MSLWDALRMNMMISYQELVRTFLSTGGFTKDARYEADRSTIPLTLWTLDDLVRALIENYEQVDIETKLLVPLKKTFLPA